MIVLQVSIFQLHESDLFQCVPPLNGFTYTVYDSRSLITDSEGTKLSYQATLTICDVEQGVTYVVTIIAVNDVGEGEPAITTICELPMIINFVNCLLS